MTFTKDELSTIGMVVGNRAQEVRKIISETDYVAVARTWGRTPQMAEITRAADNEYAATLEALAEKAHKMYREYR